MKTLSSRITENGQINEAINSTILKVIMTNKSAENKMFIEHLKNQYALSRITDDNFKAVPQSASEMLGTFTDYGRTDFIAIGGAKHSDADRAGRITLWAFNLNDRDSTDSKVNFPINMTGKKTNKAIFNVFEKTKNDYMFYQLVNLGNLQKEKIKSDKYGSNPVDLGELYAAKKKTREEQARQDKLFGEFAKTYKSLGIKIGSDVDAKTATALAETFNKLTGFSIGVNSISPGQVEFGRSNNWLSGRTNLNNFNEPDSLYFGMTLITELLHALIESTGSEFIKIYGFKYYNLSEILLKSKYNAEYGGKKQTKKDKSMGSIPELPDAAAAASWLVNDEFFTRHKAMSNDDAADYLGKTVFLFKPSKKNALIILTTKSLAGKLKTAPYAKDLKVLPAITSTEIFSVTYDLTKVPEEYLSADVSIITMNISKGDNRLSSNTQPFTDWTNSTKDSWKNVELIMPDGKAEETTAYETEMKTGFLNLIKTIHTKYPKQAKKQINTDYIAGRLRNIIDDLGVKVTADDEKMFKAELDKLVAQK